MNLNKARREINKIDREIIDLFQKRMDLVEIIAEIKIENNLDIEDSNREREILKKLNSFEYSEELKKLYREIFTISKEYQNNNI